MRSWPLARVAKKKERTFLLRPLPAVQRLAKQSLFRLARQLAQPARDESKRQRALLVVALVFRHFFETEGYACFQTYTSPHEYNRDASFLSPKVLFCVANGPKRVLWGMLLRIPLILNFGARSLWNWFHMAPFEHTSRARTPAKSRLRRCCAFSRPGTRAAFDPFPFFQTAAPLYISRAASPANTACGNVADFNRFSTA